MQRNRAEHLSTRFPGYPQSDESGDGPEDEPAARQQAEHAEGGSADEQAQPSEHTKVSRIEIRSTSASQRNSAVRGIPVEMHRRERRTS